VVGRKGSVEGSRELLVRVGEISNKMFGDEEGK
jgi:hypothetical protein